MRDEEKRQCLPCTACCQGWLHAEVLGNVLRAGQGCPHCHAAGCGVYAIRPRQPCQTYICSWLVAGSPLPNWMRPDLSGVIVLLNVAWLGMQVITAIPAGQAIPERALNWLKDYAQKHKRPLVYYQRSMDAGAFSGLKRFCFGPVKVRELLAQQSAQSPPGLDTSAA